MIQTYNKNFSVEYNARLDGFVNGGRNYFVSLSGKLKQKNNFCPRCGRTNYVDNGFHFVEDSFILSLGLRIGISQFGCKSCGCFWSSGREIIDAVIKEYDDILKSLLLGCARSGLSFESACTLVDQKIGDSYSPQYVNDLYSEALENVKNEKFSSASGVYHYDEQYLLVNGEERCRLTIKDAVTDKIILDVQTSNSQKETIKKELHKALDGLPVYSFILDMKQEYPELIKELFPKAKIQWCIFHLYKLIWKELKEEYGKYMRLNELYNAYLLFNTFFNHEPELKKLEELLKNFNRFKTGDSKSDKQIENCLIREFRQFVKELKKERRRNKENIPRRTLEKSKNIFQEIKKQAVLFPKKLQKRINFIDENWEKFTLFQKDSRVPPTNNNLEQYFSATLQKTDKKDFRSKEAATRELNASRAEWNGQQIFPTKNLTNLLNLVGTLYRAFPPT